MEILVEANCPNIKKYVETLAQSFLSQLKLVNSKAFVNVFVEEDSESSGECAAIFEPEIGLDGYVVTIKQGTWYDMGVSLAHEFVHVRQYVKGYLQPLGGPFNVWCNKVYGPCTRYLDQPWEIDAFSRQELLLRNALEA
jgi:hypothetical protein